MVTDYGLCDRASVFGRVKESFLLASASGAHSASDPLSSRNPFPGGKVRPGCGGVPLPPSSAEIKNE
jgi:hypothetical protein